MYPRGVYASSDVDAENLVSHEYGDPEKVMPEEFVRAVTGLLKFVRFTKDGKFDMNSNLSELSEPIGLVDAIDRCLNDGCVDRNLKCVPVELCFDPFIAGHFECELGRWAAHRVRNVFELYQE